MTIISVGHFVLSMVALFFGTLLLVLLEGVLLGRDPINLHIGTAILVTILGSLAYLIWGWPSTLTIVAILTLWTLVGVLLQRRDRGSAG